MKVAFVGPYPAVGADPVGGVQIATVRLARELAAMGVEVAVVAPAASAAVEQDDAVAVHRVAFDGGRALARALRPWRRAVAAGLARVRPDVVHGQGLLLGAPPAADWRGGPTLVTAHGSPFYDALSAGRTPGAVVRAYVAQRIARAAAARVNAVVGVNPRWDLHFARRPRRFVHIPNPVDVAPVPAAGERAGARVLYCGGGRWLKGWDVLRDAWPLVRERVPHAELLVLGWPEDVDAGLRPADGITVRGWVGEAAVRAEMTRASLVVVPSRFEVAPMVVTDAWTARTPVIAAAVGGVPAFAGGAAVLVPPDAPAALADALATVLADPGGVAPLVEAGARRAANWTARRVAEEHQALYVALAAQRRRGV